MLSAASMVLVQPAIVTSLSFQLSVVATAALVLLAESFEQWLAIVPKTFGLRSSLASTVAAIICTQPLILLYFGQVSLIAPLVNVMVLPLVPLAMLTGFITSLITAAWPVVAALVGWLAWLPLRSIVAVVVFGADLPAAAVQVPAIVSVWLAAVTALLIGWLVVKTRSLNVAT
jgi:competence protein ComEC